MTWRRWSTGAQAVGDFISRIGDRADIAKVVEVGEKLAGWAERVGLNRVLRAADSAILDGGQVVIAGMRLTTGFGAPEAGERFGTGSARFRDAAATLSSAQPTDDWSGEGARRLCRPQCEAEGRRRRSRRADHAVHRVLATEAYQVNFHRDRLDGWSNWLADVGLVTFGIGLIPGYGKAAKEATELAAVMTAVGSSSLELRALSSEVETNSAELGQLLRSYEDVGTSTDPVGSGPRPPDPPPPGGHRRPRSPPKPDVPPGQTPPDALPTPASNPGGSAASGGAGVGGGSGARGGGGPAPATSPTARPHVPATPAPAPSQASRGAAPAAMGAAPAGPGPAPAAPSAVTPSIPAALINQAVQSAVQKAVEKALEEADERRDREEEAKKADDGLDGDGEDEDGDDAPDTLATDEHDGREIPPTAAMGAADAGLAPIGPANVSDPASPERPIAATLDREKFNRADAGASTIGR